MRCVLLAFAALAMVAEPCAAQEVASAQTAAAPYERIYDTLIAQADDRPAIEAGLDWMVKELAKNPDMAAVEAAYPGVTEKLRAAFRPIMTGYSQRVKLAYRPRMVALFQAELTEAEAAEVAEFYASPIGHRLVAGIVDSYRPDAVLGTLGTDQRVDAADVEQDLNSATAGMLHGLSAAETAELYRELAARPAVAKLVPVVPRIAALRAEMEEEPMTAKEEAAIEAAVEEVFASIEPSRPRK